ncbi:MAG TPA: metallophosphoesterase family protein [Gaiellaceae bacterium]|nr:metallophosphoesterase family protein [Gaiellaceae bacterium]
MRIAYLVDVHDRFDAVPAALAEIGPVDALVVGGDLTTAGSPEDAERAVRSWLPLAPRLFAVAGNMDSPAIDARLVELGVSLDGRGAILGDVGLHGASASPFTPLHTPHELPDEELGRRARAGHAEAAAARVRIFCPHAPPHGACDRLRSGERVGSAALRAFVEEAQPDLVLCGHIHEARGEEAIGRTRVVNPGPAADGHWALVEVADELSVALDER